MQKPFCKMTLQDLLDYIAEMEEIKMKAEKHDKASDPAEPVENPSGWLSQEKIAAFLGIDLHILNEYMQDGSSDLSSPEQLPFYRFTDIKL